MPPLLLKILATIAGSVADRLLGRWLQERRAAKIKAREREQLANEIKILQKQRDVPAVATDADLVQLANDNAARNPDLES